VRTRHNRPVRSVTRRYPVAAFTTLAFVLTHTDGSALLAVLLHAGMNLSTLSASVAGDSVRVVALVLLLKWRSPGRSSGPGCAPAPGPPSRPGRESGTAGGGAQRLANSAIRPRMPLRKRGESSVDICLASSTASLIATGSSISPT
jgi:hypothetical protein